MLTQLEVFSPGITTPPLLIGDGTPAGDLIQIHNISGLEPVKATVNTNPYGSINGEAYNGSSVGNRNIVLTVGLSPDWTTQTVTTLRQILYDYFTPTTPVRLRFSSTELPVVEISGIVESCEPDLFSKDSEIQISIICPLPDFVAVDSTTISGETLAFTDTETTDIVYKGIPTGFVVDVSTADGGATMTGEIRIVNKVTSTNLLSVVGQVDSTHFVRVSTVPGNKYADQLIVPVGSPVNLIGKVAPGSIWMPLQKGINRFQVLSETPGLGWSLNYYARYGGL